ncbi:nucleotide exchange factor GrpE [Saccharothrix variisporea]|uniref:GrpE protein n=1 Tax=Saccharothrix variisporea TaxID=543527 RepID=A0A495XGS6_9PSEU|nr:nucleotide exchange factor GrpE [Saccharothrix variisporea]RKT73671.1 GrpE protein [Saccharothrix variisporea]
MYRVAIALVVLGALITFTSLALVLSPGAPDVDVRAVAVRALDSARRATDSVAVADEVAGVLPPGARAVVVRPAHDNEQPSRTATPRVAVLVGDVDQAAVGLLVASGGMVGAHATPDGWWASVAVPATVPPPTLPALALLVGAVLLGAAATGVNRTKAAPPSSRQKDVLVRGLTDLMPKLPEGVAWQAENLLAAAGVRLVVPDGRPVDPRRHHVVGTEPTDDEDAVDTVARTVRPGYADGERMVVCPSVIAYVPDEG